MPARSVAPDDAAAHFGWLSGFVALDAQASSDATSELLGWRPTGPSLLEDLDSGRYTAALRLTAPA